MHRKNQLNLKSTDEKHVELSSYSEDLLENDSLSGFASQNKRQIKLEIAKYNVTSGQVKIDDVRLDNVIVNSNLRDINPSTQAKNVLSAFNRNVVKGKGAFATSLFVGEWVNPDKYILGACNQTPELRFYDGAMKIRRGWYVDPTVNTEILSQHEQSELVFGVYGSYVLNVPPNKLAKIWSGNVPFLYNTGPHVIHDATFKFSPDHGLVDQTDPYINHGSIHILRVPAGMLAKIWIGATPHLLESREEPYVFDTALFRLDRKDANNLFYSATDDLITHGSTKRVMPRTGQVAITYNNGNLEIIKPSENTYSTIIKSATHEVRGFLNTNVQQLVFPSDEEKKKRHRDNSQISADELNHYVYTTKDNLKICMKLLVSYHIKDPYKTLSQLGENNILSTVENLASVDMGKMVIRLSSQEFMNPYSAAQEVKNKPNPSKSVSLEEESYQPSFWDEIRNGLSDELANYGIELIRFNIETPFVLDKEIAKKMSEYATLNAEANAKQAIIVKQAQVQKAEAERDAMTKQIEQEQLNNAVVSKAQAELKAAQLRAEAMLVQTEAEAKAKHIQAETDAKIKALQAEADAKARVMQSQAEAEAIKNLGKAYDSNKCVYTLKEQEIVGEAVGKMNTIVPYPPQTFKHFTNPDNYRSFNRFFGQPPKSADNINQANDPNILNTKDQSQLLKKTRL